MTSEKVTLEECPETIREDIKAMVSKWTQLTKKSDDFQKNLEKKTGFKLDTRDETEFVVMTKDGSERFNWMGEPFDEDQTTKMGRDFATKIADDVQKSHSDFYEFCRKLRWEEEDTDEFFSTWGKNGYHVSINNWASDMDEAEIYLEEDGHSSQG
jgi:hypothetical protein